MTANGVVSHCVLRHRLSGRLSICHMSAHIGIDLLNNNTGSAIYCMHRLVKAQSSLCELKDLYESYQNMVRIGLKDSREVSEA